MANRMSETRVIFHYYVFLLGNNKIYHLALFYTHNLYVCIHVCMYVRMYYVCMYIRMYVCMYVRMYVCMYVVEVR